MIEQSSTKNYQTLICALKSFGNNSNAKIKRYFESVYFMYFDNQNVMVLYKYSTLVQVIEILLSLEATSLSTLTSFVLS